MALILPPILSQPVAKQIRNRIRIIIHKLLDQKPYLTLILRIYLLKLGIFLCALEQAVE